MTINLNYNELGSKTKEWFQQNFEIIVCNENLTSCASAPTFDNLFGPDSKTTLIEAINLDGGDKAGWDQHDGKKAPYYGYDKPGRRLRGAATFVSQTPFKIGSDGNLNVVAGKQIGPPSKDVNPKGPTPDYTCIGFHYFAAFNLNFQMKLRDNKCTNNNTGFIIAVVVMAVVIAIITLLMAFFMRKARKKR